MEGGNLFKDRSEAYQERHFPFFLFARRINTLEISVLS